MAYVGNKPSELAIQLDNATVTTAKLANDAVTAAKIVDGTIVADDLNAGIITNAKVNASAAIAASKIAISGGANITLQSDGTFDLDNTINLTGGLQIGGTGIIDSSRNISNINNADIDGTLNIQGETTLQTHLNLGDNDRIKLGSGSDIQIYHDGSYSRIMESGGTGFVLDTTSTDIRLTADNSEVMGKFIKNGAVQLFHDNSQKLSTTSSGVTVTGELLATTVDATTLQIGGTSITATAAELNRLDLTTFGTAQATKALTTDSSNFVNFPDNAKIRMGTGNDLQIYHISGFNQIETTNGPIQIKTSSKNMIKAIPDGAVELYHNNVKRIETTSSGATLTGSLLTTNIYGANDGNTGIQFEGSDVLTFHSGGQENIQLTSNAIVFNQDSVDMDFRVESNNVSSMLFVDGGTDRVGIGTDSPVNQLHVNGSGADVQARIQTTSAGYASRLRLDGANYSGGSYNAIQSYQGDAGAAWEISGAKANATNQFKLFTGGTLNLHFENNRMNIPEQPIAVVEKTTSTSVGAAQTQIVVFNEVRRNHGSMYNTSNGRFTAPVAGNYLITVELAANGQSDIFHIGIFLNNGIITPIDPWINYGDGQRGGSRTLALNLAAGDFLTAVAHFGSNSGTLEANRNRATFYKLG